MHGVGKVYIEKEGEEQRLIVEHDPITVTVEQLTNALEGLPSFYEGFFKASVTKAQRPAVATQNRHRLQAVPRNGPKPKSDSGAATAR